MGSVELDSAQGPVTFTIKGDEPSRSEMIKIQTALRGLQIDYDVGSEDTEFTGSSVDQNNVGFDRTTGIQDAGLRAGLSIVDDAEEREAVLQRNGLTVEDYTRDSGGQLALTPSGAKKFGIETDQNIIIDEKGMSANDISDLAGIAPEIGGAVGGALVGQVLIPIPFLGAALGAAFGGGGANLIEEFGEYLAGVSRQTPGEIAKQTGKEALLSGLFEGAGQIVFKGISKLFSPSGSKLSPADLKLAGESIEAGITPSLSALGSPSLISRQQALAERIFKSSPRLKKNHEAITAKIEKFRNDAGASDVNDLGRILKEAAESGNNKLLKEQAEISREVMAHMTNVADDLGRAAVADLTIDANLFTALSQSFKHFDDLSAAGFKKIDEINSSVVGNADIIPSGSLKVMVDDLGGTAKYDNIIPNTSQDLEKSILVSMGNVGEKSSFAKLYSARKSLNDTKMAQGAEQGVYNMANKFIDEIDTLLSRKNLSGIDSVTFRASRGGGGKGSRSKLLAAADSVAEQRKLYAEGMRQFDALEHSSILKNIANTVRNNKPIDASKMESSILKSNAPERLRSLKKVLDNQADRMNVSRKAGSRSVVSEYENLRSRMAGEWLRRTIDESTSILDPTQFSGKQFSTAYKKLGTTADELFGSQAAQVKKLAEQMDSLSLSSLDQKIIGLLKEGEIFADDGIDLLKGVLTKKKSWSEFQRNSIVKKLKDGSLDDVEAAAYINNPSTKASDIDQIMAYFSDDASKKVLRGSYMDNLIGDFDAKFLTDPTQFRAFASKLINDKDKNAKVFGDKMAEEMEQFGKILKLNSKSAEGGELVAASIAASPLQNLGKIAKFTAIGRMFSSDIFYKRFMRDYKTLIGQNKKPMDFLPDLLSSSIAQFTGQASSQGISKETDRVKNLINNSVKDNTGPRTPAPKTPTTRNTPVPNVQPGALEGLPYKVVPPSPLSAKTSIRQRAMGDPTIAASLLGGLGSASLLNRP